MIPELRDTIGQLERLVYQAVKAGTVAELSHENQLGAQAMPEHMHLKHVHNALEFADLRDGPPYEITVEGNTVNPLAHVVTHWAVKGQVEQAPSVRAAFEKLVATGASAHHAEHVLGALLLEAQWAGAHAVRTGKDTGKVLAAYNRKLQKLVRDAAFRRKFTRQFTADHFAFE